ncbi:MAG TPA: hypothetical protein VOB72_10480 [Candidatus Dormibacteraeota bacterium]|nr:hypothetical protein [Candidatus Dormibacteraeota bacterium]
MAGEADFTPDEWQAIQKAVTVAGVLVAYAEGGRNDILDEVFAITQLLGAARSDPNQLLREAARMRFQPGIQPGMKYADYEAPALEAIRTAVAAVLARSPGDVAVFRAFLVKLAEAAANAHKEGGFAGVGGTRVSPAEAVAIARVKQAAGIP